MENRYKINYDIKQRCITNAKFTQGDSNTAILDITLFDGGTIVDITGESIIFYFDKSDGTYTAQDSTTGVTIINPAQGNVVCSLLDITTACTGIVECQIERKKDGNLLTTAEFAFVVNERIANKILISNYVASIENKMVEWGSNESDRQARFISSQNDKQNTFNASETNRINTFNTNETTRQSDFSQIKADYNTYKNVMTDSSNVANLQNQINNLRIADNTANKKYTFQIQVNNGKPQLIYTEVV